MTIEAEKLVEKFRALSQKERCEALREIREGASAADLEAWDLVDIAEYDQQWEAEEAKRWENAKDDESQWEDWEVVYQSTKERLRRN